MAGARAPAVFFGARPAARVQSLPRARGGATESAASDFPVAALPYLRPASMINRIPFQSNSSGMSALNSQRTPFLGSVSG